MMVEKKNEKVRLTMKSWREICGFLLETVVLIWVVGVIFALLGLPVLLSVGAAVVLALLLDFLQKKIWKTTLGNRSFCADDTAAFLQLPIAKQIRIVISSLVLLLGVALLFL